MPDMPPDPFTAADEGYAVILADFRGFRRAGAGLVEAALLTAAHIALNGAVGHAQELPDGEPPQDG